MLGQTLEIRCMSAVSALDHMCIHESNCWLGNVVVGSGGLFLCFPLRNVVRISVVVQVPAVCLPVDVAMLPLHAVTVVGEKPRTVCP